MESVTQLHATHTDLDERGPFKMRVSTDTGFVPMSITSHYSCLLFLPVCCRAPLGSCSGPEEQKKPE